MPEVEATSTTPRIIAFINEKGGVGKTTVSLNVAGCLAQAGMRTLVVDIDPQGGVLQEFKLQGTEFDDEGAALYRSIIEGAPVELLAGIRDNLDVVVGGGALKNTEAQIVQRFANGEMDLMFSLKRALETVAGNYDFIIIDCPPGNVILQNLALVAAQWIIVPTRADNSSIQNVGKVAATIQKVSYMNPDLDTLGIVLFSIPSSQGTKTNNVLERAKAAVTEHIGSPELIFNTAITSNEKAAQDNRMYGLLSYEANNLVSSIDWTRRFSADVSDDEKAVLKFSATHKKIAQNYIDLTQEVINRLITSEGN